MYKAVLIDCTGCKAENANHPFPSKYLISALAETMRTSRGTVWQTELTGHEMLRFFVDSPYEQAVAIVWVDATADRNQAISLAKAYARDTAGFPSDLEPNDLRQFLWASESDDEREVSRFLRGNDKIRGDWFAERNGLRCLADSQGFAVLADADGAARAARAAQVHALAMAYQNALYDIANAVSAAAKEPESNAERTLRDVTQFMAANYFGHPVLPNTRELREFYQLISAKQNLMEQFSEAVSQVERLAVAVRERQRDEERKRRLKLSDEKADIRDAREARDNKLASRVNTLNVLVAVMGLFIAASGLTPESIRKWRAAWMNPSVVSPAPTPAIEPAFQDKPGTQKPAPEPSSKPRKGSHSSRSSNARAD